MTMTKVLLLVALVAGAGGHNGDHHGDHHNNHHGDHHNNHHGDHHGGSTPGSPFNISRNDRGLQRAVLATINSFNNQSNDAFLFKNSTIHRAQQQIVKGIRYLVDLDISRTLCRKRDQNHDLSQCDFQPVGVLHQTFWCHSEVLVIPWKKETKVLDFLCRP